MGRLDPRCTCAVSDQRHSALPSRRRARAAEVLAQAADEAFATALEFEPKYFLALNARGVVSHAVGNTLQARVFFQKATAARPDFADAYASRGALNVYQSSSRAAEAFENAAQHSKEPDTLVSILGRGCVAFGQGEYDDAQNLFSSIPAQSPLSDLAKRNQLATHVEQLRVLAEQAHAVGTTLEAVELTAAAGQALFAKITIGIGLGIGIGPGGLPIVGPVINITIEPDDKPANTGGEEGSNTSAMVALPPEVLPPITFPPGFPDFLRPGGFPGGALSPEQLEDVISAVAEATAITSREVNEAVEARAATSAEAEPGGADADSRRVRSSRGPWPVTTVYGLLYAIPVRDDTPTIDGV